MLLAILYVSSVLFVSSQSTCNYIRSNSYGTFGNGTFSVNSRTVMPTGLCMQNNATGPDLKFAGWSRSFFESNSNSVRKMLI